MVLEIVDTYFDKTYPIDVHIRFNDQMVFIIPLKGVRRVGRSEFINNHFMLNEFSKLTTKHTELALDWMIEQGLIN